MTWLRSHSKLTAESQPASNPPKSARSGHLLPQREEVRPARVHRAAAATPQSTWAGSLRTGTPVSSCSDASMPPEPAPDSHLRAPRQW